MKTESNYTSYTVRPDHMTANEIQNVIHKKDQDEGVIIYDRTNDRALININGVFQELSSSNDIDQLFELETDGQGNITKIISLYDFQVPAQSIEVGESIKISDLGQVPSYSTKYNNKQYLLLGYEFDETGSKTPSIKVFGEPTSFDLQPIDTTTQRFNTPVDFSVTSQQDVIGETYTLKIDSSSDVRFQVVREAENGGEEAVLVDEIIPQNTLSLDGVSFDLTPVVDFEANKVYRLVFSVDAGFIDVKGVIANATNGNGVSRAVDTSFIPYIRREKGFEYETKNLAMEGESGSQVVQSATPPEDNTKLWFNTNDEKLYFYDSSDWLTEQLFEVVFNDQGSTPNNTFLRIGNTVSNDTGVGYNLDFTAKIESLSFSRTSGTAQAGNYWLYSNTATGTNNAAVVTVFNVDNSARGLVLPNTETTINADSYIAVRWNGNQTNNNIVTLKYRKKHV